MAVTEVGTPAAAAVQSGSNAGSVTGAWSGTQPRTAGDLLVADVTAYGTTTAGTISTPAGWSRAYEVTSADGRTRVAQYTKAAAGSDAAPAFTATMTGTAASERMSCFLHELAGQDGSAPVATSGTGTAAANSATATTSGNVPAAGCYAIAAWVQVNSSTGTTTLTPGSGWTSQFSTGTTSTRAHEATDVQSSPAAGAALSDTLSSSANSTVITGGLLVIAPPSGVAGAAALSGSGTLRQAQVQQPGAALAGSGTLGEVQVQPGAAALAGSGTLAAPGAPPALKAAAAVTTGGAGNTLAVPAQPCAAGDIIFIWAAIGFPAVTFTADPADSFTAASANSPASPLQVSAQLFWKTADSGDVAKAGSAGTYTLTQGGGTTHPFSAVTGVFTPADAANPFDPAPSGSGVTADTVTTVTAPGVTTASPGDLLIWLGADRIASGGVPPAITPPSGYAVPPGLSQASTSGSGTANTGVLIATAVQAAAGATGDQAGSISAAQDTAGLLLAARAVPPAAAGPGTVVQMAAGAPAADGFGVVAKTSGATSCRLAVSAAADMSSPSYLAAQVPDSSGYIRFAASGLGAFTRYWCQVADTPPGGTETLTGPVGSVRTLPAAGSPASFTVALASCIERSDTVTPPATGAAIADWVSYGADLNIMTGDFDYSGTTSTDTPTQVGVYETQIAGVPSLGSMISTAWGYYCRSDHEAGPDNGDSNNAYTAANIAAAQQVFPMGGPLDTASSPPHGLWQAWTAGRVRFILLDIRNTDRSPGSNTDDSSKTMLGAAQLAWLEAELIRPELLKVIISDVAWMGAASITNGPDKWWSYSTERQAIISYIAANAAQVQNVMLWHGDSHCLGATPGPSNSWGGFPVLCAAPLLNTGGGRNLSTFTQMWNNSGGECRAYGRISFTDDGSVITVVFQGWDAAAGVARISQTDTFSAPVPGAAALSGAGHMGLAEVTGPSAALTGSGALSAAQAQQPTAALSGQGTLTQALARAVTAALSGAGTLTGAEIQAVTAALSGAGTMAQALVQALTAALSGAGTLSGALIRQVSAALSGAGTLSEAQLQRVTAALTGAGTLSETTAGGTALSGAGTLGAGIIQAVTAALSGAGTLSQAQLQQAAAALSGAGTLTQAQLQRVTAALTGAGTMAQAQLQRVTAGLSGAGTLGEAGTQQPAAALSGAGTLAAAPGFRQPAAAALGGAGALLAGPALAPVAGLSGAGSLAWSRFVTVSDSDAGHGEDSGITLLAGSDAGTAADAGERIALADADAGTAAEAELSAWPADADAGTAAERAWWSGPLADSDAGHGADAGERIALADADAGHGADGYGPVGIWTEPPPWHRGGWFEIRRDGRTVLTAPRLEPAVLELARRVAEAGELAFVSDADAGTAAEHQGGPLEVTLTAGPEYDIRVELESETASLIKF